MHAQLLPDGRRLHLQHGPIDLVIEAWGRSNEIAAAYDQARGAFAGLLEELVEELPLLRRPLGPEYPYARGSVARRMIAATWPFRSGFITPMAAVAGSVADHVLAEMLAGRSLAKAYVNDGGDIAIHLEPGESLVCGIVAEPIRPRLDGRIALDGRSAVRGIATSGSATKESGGRSFSLGIADAATVLASSAAEADAAATIIANAVDLPDHPMIRRVPASSLDPDSDLGERPVTLAVGPLLPAEIERALEGGRRMAEALCRAGLILGAALALRGELALVGAVPLLTKAA